MSTEANNPTESNMEERKRLDREVMDMISALTNSLTSLQRAQKAQGGSGQLGQEEEHGVSIITMAGHNSGATMRSDAGDQKWVNHQLAPPPPGEHEAVAPPEWATFVNSNLQAINNSIMLETKYKSNDPGVHMEISEALDHKGHKNQKHSGWKGKAKAASVSSYDSAPHSP